MPGRLTAYLDIAANGVRAQANEICRIHQDVDLLNSSRTNEILPIGD